MHAVPGRVPGPGEQRQRRVREAVRGAAPQRGVAARDVQLLNGSATESLAPGVALLRGFAAPTGPLVTLIDDIARLAPFRKLHTPGGRPLSVRMTACGPLGWHSDAQGYRYVTEDPGTDRPWPAMPARFRDLAVGAAAAAGFPGFEPDACLVNRYEPGARMGAHRDADEQDFTQPIVSVSIGLPAVFEWFGARRGGTPLRVTLLDGDVLVWGGEARLGYHGIRPVVAPEAPDLLAATESRAGSQGVQRADGQWAALRYNLTFRRAA
jgi:alkylated DNA repair protein (DNA oxidative demethylase)